MDVLDGKGGGRKGRFQGKVSKLEKRGEAEELLRKNMKDWLLESAVTINLCRAVSVSIDCGLSKECVSCVWATPPFICFTWATPTHTVLYIAR